jgi:hypothetical protein
MPNDVKQTLEDWYNKLIKSGTGALRDLNVREQMKNALADAIGKAFEKAIEGKPEAKKYKDEFSKKTAAAIIDAEPLDQTFHVAKDALVDIADYLEQRLSIPATIQGVAQTVAGKTIPTTQLDSVKSAVFGNAIAARELDEKISLRIKQGFSFNPSLVLDPTVSFIKKVDAAYNVTITQCDATVKLHTGFSIEKPLTSNANLNANVRVDFTRPGMAAYIQGSTHFEDLYHRPTLTGSQIGAGLQMNLAPNATLNLDYNVKNLHQSRPEQSVFLGISIRF